MHSVGKRAWKKKLDEDSAMNRNVKTLPSGVHVAGGTSIGPSKKKVKQPKHRLQQIFLQFNIRRVEWCRMPNMVAGDAKEPPGEG